MAESRELELLPVRVAPVVIDGGFEAAIGRMMLLDGIDSDYGNLTEGQCRRLLRAAIGQPAAAADALKGSPSN